MKIALGQVNLTIGDVKGNFDKVKEYIQDAVRIGADLVIFPEMTNTVKGANGLLFDEEYASQSKQFLDDLLPFSNEIDIIIGATYFVDSVKNEFVNAAYFLHKGIIKLVSADEYDVAELFEVKGCKFSVLLGSSEPREDGEEFVVKMNSKPFVKPSDAEKVQPILGMKTVYISHVGLSEEGVYIGESYVADENGDFLSLASSYKSELLVVDTECSQRTKREVQSCEAEIFNTLSFAMKEFCRVNRFEKAILGLSGGIDSALTAAIVCDAIGAQNVLGITMPSKYSSEGSWNDSYELAKNLGMECRTIPIKPLFDTFVTDIQGQQYCDLAEENLQSRLRGNILMTFSNRENRVLLSTGNKSEAAMGYCTLYGDTAGGINLLADLYKQEVYALSRYVNRNGEIIPESTITKPPSAELRPDQKDSDSLPDYAVLDDILHRYVEEEQSVAEISKHYDEVLVRDIVNKLNRMEFKRRQFTYCVKVSKKSLEDRCFPLVNTYRC